MSRKVLLDLDIGDGEGQNQIGINRDYAERYDNWRRLEEMQKCNFYISQKIDYIFFHRKSVSKALSESRKN